MNQHQKQPGSESESHRWDHEDSNAHRTSPSVAPVAYQLEEEREEPPETPLQSAPTFSRNVLVAIGIAIVAFLVFGVAGSLKPPSEPAVRVGASALEPPSDEEAFDGKAFVGLVSESAQMSLLPAEAKRIANRANASARMSLSRLGRVRAGNDSLPQEKASVLKSTEESLVDVAASAATLRCMDASEFNPALRVRVRFAPDGSVASVDFEGALGYSPETLACIEDVFGELEIAGYRGGERTFVRELGGVP